MKRLPQSIRRFVEGQTTLSVSDTWKDDPKERRSPCGSYWYRAVACLLLSGRIQPKADGYPNRTDVNRACKEANFNQYLCERVARFLVATEVVTADRRGLYGEGKNFATFWRHDPAHLQAITRPAVFRFIQEHTGHTAWRPTMVMNAHLIEFLMLFFSCFKGLALPESQVGQAYHDFATLPWASW